MDSRVRPQFLQLSSRKSRRICGLSALWFRILFHVFTLFSILLQAIPKADLSTYVLYLMIYLMFDELWLMSYLMAYVILRSYDLTALVYLLFLGLQLDFNTVTRLVWMYFVLCLFLRIHEDMSLFVILTNSYSTWETSPPNDGYSHTNTSGPNDRVTW